MKIHEFQAKELLAAAGAAIPRGIVATSPAEAAAAFDTVGGPVVLKAQIHAGGRGKGHFKDSGKDFGGVKFIKSRDDCAAVAEVMFKYPLVTKQTDEEGQKVSKVLVVQASAKILREVYVGMVLDRAIGLPVMMACAEGGVEIEEVAAHTPEKILKEQVDPDAGLHPFQARRLAFALGFTGEQVGQAEKIMHRAVEGLSGEGLQPGRDQPAGAHGHRRSAGGGRQDHLRRQRAVPPSRRRETARRGGGESRRVARGSVGVELHQPDGKHRLSGQRCRPGHEHDGHHQVSRRQPRPTSSTSAAGPTRTR